jgi:hypothetical protein
MSPIYASTTVSVPKDGENDDNAIGLLVMYESTQVISIELIVILVYWLLPDHFFINCCPFITYLIRTRRSHI